MASMVVNFRIMVDWNQETQDRLYPADVLC